MAADSLPESRSVEHDDSYQSIIETAGVRRKISQAGLDASKSESLIHTLRACVNPALVMRDPKAIHARPKRAPAFRHSPQGKDFY
jgi:hypothetical protein